MKKIIPLLLILVLVLSGCGGNSGTTKSSDQNQKAKDTFVFAQGADITSLDPQIGKETSAITVTGNIFDTLVAYNSEMEIVPSLAESWERVSDTSIKFALRQGVKFHNGDTMTADDVKFSIERAMKSPQVSYIVDFISSVEKVDDYTVIVNTKEPFAPLIAHLANPAIAIVPQKVVQADEKGFALHPIGTGPYKFVEWKQGEYAKLEAFDDYFMGKPKTEYIIMKVVPENSQRIIALETGEVDAAYDILPNDISKVKENKDLTLMTTPSARCIYLSLNTKAKGPMSNPDVRHAIEYALDKETITKTALYGIGQAASCIIPPVAFGYNKERPVSEFNKDKAKELLKKAGYPDGFEITLWTDDDQSRVELCQIVQSELAEIGIKVNMEVMEFGTLLSRLSEPDHPMVMEFWTTSTADANYTYYSLFYSGSSADAGNDAFYNNPDADKLIMDGRNSVDEAKRIATYNSLNEMLNKDLPYIPLYYTEMTVAASKKVAGFEINPMGYHRLNKVSVSE